MLQLKDTLGHTWYIRLGDISAAKGPSESAAPALYLISGTVLSLTDESYYQVIEALLADYATNDTTRLS